ncbi:hypothetical protein [Lederbergia panacisoli]|uniref:hypothetical protein n=1 Tax=Lederbergia panacisoli TaxID=1255251 RepID=UPI00214BA6A2|nr:hypothetical protein [Lederbergia panacisoli]MCR2822384.1 hypothetical protein [Lederbergia panacisoli]
MKKTFFISLIIAIVMIGSLSALQLSMPIVLAITFIFIFLIILSPQIYYMYFSNNVNKIERFMKKNLKQPIIALYYGVANNDDQFVSDSLEKILKKYKKPHHQAIFKTVYALYKKDITEMKQYIIEIKPLQFQYYYEGIVSISEGDFIKAEEYIGKIKTVWMKYVLMASLEQENGSKEKAKTYAKTAIENAKGLQKYLIYKHTENFINK